MKWNKRDRWPSIYLFDIQICIFTMYHTHILTDILWQKCHLSRLMLIYVWQEQSAKTLMVNLLIFFSHLLHELNGIKLLSHVRVTMRVLMRLFWFFDHVNTDRIIQKNLWEIGWSLLSLATYSYNSFFDWNVSYLRLVL